MSPAAEGGVPLVAPYVITMGRSAASRNHFDVVTLITLSDVAASLDQSALTPEQRAVLELVRPSAQSVSEISAHLRLPLSVLRILLADLMDGGHITPSHRITEASRLDQTLLEEVLAGLKRL